MTKILVVDDSMADLKLAESILKSSFEVTLCRNGDDLETHLTNNKPDLILMDVVMPERNGFELTRKIKRDENTKDIPIIMISAKDTPTDINWGKRQGASDYLVKPYTPTVLLKTISEVLAR